MKTKYIFLLTFLCSVTRGFAQTDSSYTLKQCIDYALEHQSIYLNSTLDAEIAKARVGEIQAIGLPQINGTVSMIENSKLRNMFFSKTNPFATLGTDGELTGDVVAAKNIFQLPSSGDAGATISQLLFDGSYFVGLKAAKAYQSLAQKTIQQSKIQTVDNVTKAYYLVLITQERISRLNSSIATLDSTVRQSRQMYENGFIEKIDLDRLEVSLNNLLSDKSKFDSGLDISKMLLKFQMGKSMDEPIIASDTLALNSSESVLLKGTKANYHERIEYALLENQKILQNLDLKNVKAGYYPSISAFATGGYTRQDVKFVNLFQYKWYSYALLGVNMNVPIFDGFGRHYKGQQKKLELRKTENNILALKNTIDMQVRQSEITVNNAIRTLEVQQKNMDLATNVARVVKIKYAEGVGTNIEVTNAEDALRDSQTNYYNALYDLLVAQLDYKKALGTLATE
jgi:outer membrane protein